MNEKSKFEFPETFKVTSLIKSPKQYNVEELIKIVGNKILGYNEANIIIQYNDNILNKFSTEDCELQALLDKSPLPHTYNLMVRTKLQESLEIILCHEMKHFDQYEKGDLKIKKDDSTITFIYKGKEYNSSTEYDFRPWEKEARSEQYKLWKQFKKIYHA